MDELKDDSLAFTTAVTMCRAARYFKLPALETDCLDQLQLHCHRVEARLARYSPAEAPDRYLIVLEAMFKGVSQIYSSQVLDRDRELKRVRAESDVVSDELKSTEGKASFACTYS